MAEPAKKVLAEPVAAVSTIFIASLGPLALSLLLTCDITPLGGNFYDFLERKHPYAWTVFCWGIIFCVQWYTFDMYMWRAALFPVTVLVNVLSAVCFVVGLLLYAPTAPSLPILLGHGLIMCPAFLVRRYVFTEPDSSHYVFYVSCAFWLLSLACLVVWFVEMGLGLTHWHAHAALDADWHKAEVLRQFILRKSAFMHAGGCAIIALSSMVRCSVYAHMPGKDAPAWRKEEATMQYLMKETKLAACGLLLVVLITWVAASIAANSMGLSQMVLRLGIALGVGLAIDAAYIIGSVHRFKKLYKELAEYNDAVKFLKKTIQSDWARGAFVLFFMPLLPVYFGYEVLHRYVRTALVRLHILSLDDCLAYEDAPPSCFTEEGARRWKYFMEWDKTAVLETTLLIGIIYFTLQVGVTKGLTLLLAWLGKVVAPWPLVWILVFLFVVGMAMFMFPPIPGVPVFMLCGVVITQKFHATGLSFSSACVVATVFAIFLKMSAIFVQQKLIGEMLSANLTVKSMCALETPLMKACRHILSGPFSMAKVAILVGGPDWPTSVFTGILGLPLFKMLLGSLPVTILILPVVLSSAFQVRTGHETDEAAQRFYSNVASLMLILSSIVMIGMMVTVSYYIDKILRDFATEIEEGEWMRDPQEAEILELRAETERRNNAKKELGQWRRLPDWMQSMLIVGSLSMCGMMHLVLWPFTRPFEPYHITDSVSILPGGTAWGIMNPTGAAAVILFLVGLFVYFFFSFWSSRELRLANKASAVSGAVATTAAGGSIRDL